MSGFNFIHQVSALFDLLKGVVPLDGETGKRVKTLIALLDDRDRDLENYLNDTDRRLGIASAAAGIPLGGIVLYGAPNLPDGFLECDGSAVSRAEYADLFNIVGTTWGPGDGSTTFNLPDLRGRAPIGAGQGSGLTERTVGQTGGAETHTLALSEMRRHSHDAQRWYPDSFGTYRVPTGNGPFSFPYQTFLFDEDGTVGITPQPPNGNEPHNNMQPFLVVRFIMRARLSGSEE